MGYKRDMVEIKECVKYLKTNFSFKGVLHFTDFSNLKTIFEQGYLFSRKHCENENINFVDGANHDVLDKAEEHVHNCVRFYYRGNTPTLYDNEGIKLKEYCNDTHIPIPVYLLFDEELLYLDSTEFSNGNATNSPRGNTAYFLKAMDWDAIFHNTWFEQHERDYIVNRRHAELLSKEPVPLKYLKQIIFRCEGDRKRAVNLLGNDSRYKVDVNIFSNKNFSSPKYEYQENNFIKDYKIDFEYDKNNNITAVLLEMEFQKMWQNYQTAFNIFDNKGNIIKDYRMSVLYRTVFGFTISQSINHNEIKVLKLEGNTSNWHKIEIYINDIVCIEEFLVKHDIISYKTNLILEDNRNKLVLFRQFRDYKFLFASHRCELYDESDNLLYIGNIEFDKNTRCLAWNTIFENYDSRWYKIKYFMNDVLCISQEINSYWDDIPF